MPEIITRKCGLSFSIEELRIMMKKSSLDVIEDFEDIIDFLVNAHWNDEFKGFGFPRDYEFDEISRDHEGVYMNWL